MKFSINKQQQKLFFDKEKNQFPQNSILRPSLSTQLEMKYILDKMIHKNVSVLDFGAGSGRLTMRLLQQGYEVDAVDVSTKSLDILRQVAERLKVNKRLKTYTFIPNKKYHYIVGTDVLHHVSFHQYIPKLYHRLVKNGKAIFSEPGAFNPFWYLYLPVYYGWNAEKGIIQCTISNIHNEFIHAGFKKIDVTGMGVLPRRLFDYSSTVCRIHDFLGNKFMFKQFAYRYIICASKGSSVNK